MKAYTALTLALAAVVAADTCKLTAYSVLSSTLNLDGFSLSGTDGFIFQINDLVPHQHTPTKGNGYPANYGCLGNPELYGYAHFDDPNKKGVGMCIENVGWLPINGFDCRGLGGKKFKGTTGSTFFGVGNAINAKCTVVWDC